MTILETAVHPIETSVHLPVARDSWVNAYKKGNSIWPLKYSPGINLLVMHAVLHDRPARWADFLDSTATDEQLLKVGTTMSRMHRHAGVNLFTEEHALPSENVLTVDDQQGYWSDSTEAATRTIVKFINTTRKSSDRTRYDRVTSGRVEANIDAFFADTANAGHIEQLTTISELAQGVILSKSGLKLAHLYRSGLMNHKDYPELCKEFTPVFNENGVEDGPLWKSAIRVLNVGLTSAIHEVYPDEPTDWLTSKL